MKIELKSAERYKGPKSGSGKRLTETLFFVVVDGVQMHDKWRAAAATPGERKTLAKERFLKDFVSRPLEGSILVGRIGPAFVVGDVVQFGEGMIWKVTRVTDSGNKVLLHLISEPTLGEPGRLKANGTKYEVHPTGRDPKETRPISSHDTLEEVAQSYADRDVLVTRKHGMPLSKAEADELTWHCNEWLNGPED